MSIASATLLLAFDDVCLFFVSYKLVVAEVSDKFCVCVFYEHPQS